MSEGVVEARAVGSFLAGLVFGSLPRTGGEFLAIAEYGEPRQAQDGQSWVQPLTTRAGHRLEVVVRVVGHGTGS